MNKKHLAAAEAQFKPKAEAANVSQATTQHDAALTATREKTARLRALRLEKEADDLRKPPAKRFPNRRRSAQIYVT